MSPADTRIAINLLRRSNWLYAHPLPRFSDSSAAEIHEADAQTRLAERLAALAEKVLAEGWVTVLGQFPGIAPHVTVAAVQQNWPDYTRTEAEAIAALDMADRAEFEQAVAKAEAR